MSFHNVKIQQDSCAGIGTHVFVDDKEIHGVQRIDYSISVDEVAVADVQLKIVPERVDIDVLADIGLEVTVDSTRAAISCLQLWMRLNEEYRNAMYASARSAIEEVRSSKQADVLNDYDLAKSIVDTIFFGEVER